jgi:glucosamine-6-phosphate deaminase
MHKGTIGIDMRILVFTDRKAMSRAAADQAADVIRRAIAARGHARIIAATGMSQIHFLDALVTQPNIAWERVEMFHLDEYVGLPLAHPASFRKYLLDRFITKVGMTSYHLLDGERDPHSVAREVGQALGTEPVDIAFSGIGENAHLAFNDPPADFDTNEPYLVVTLDRACRQQQVGEGWFASIDDVPTHAISMSVNQILKARTIVCVAPEARKAAAVKASVEGEISPLVPASILRTHPDVTLYLDDASAALLTPATSRAYS